ncbi:MAG: hypothetical protein HQK58_03265 [Deltaproteobacteria bacterium]|nr:hypothetical protein [Deltaproteobacteria bacterium]
MIIHPHIPQKDLGREWVALILQNNIAQYLNEVLAAFSTPFGEGPYSPLINLFLELEKRFPNHRNPLHRTHYANFFLALRESFFIPRLWSCRFELDYFNISDLLTESGIRLTPSSASEDIKDRILTDWLQSCGRVGIVPILKVFLLDYLNGVAPAQAKISFLKRFADIPATFILSNSLSAAQLKVIFERLFTGRNEVFKIFEQNVFSDEFFQKETQIQKSNLIWFVQYIAFCFYEFDSFWLRMYPRFKQILYWAIEHDQTELVFSMHFPLSHIYGNAAQTQMEFLKFNQEIDQPFSDYIINKLIPKYKLKPAQKRKDVKQLHIGFVCDRLIRNSPFMVIYSVLKAMKELNDGRFKLFLYDIEYVDKTPSNKDCVAEIINLGVCYTSNHRMIDDSHELDHYSRFNKCLKLREKVIKDEIDVLIASAGREQVNFLFSTRSAPVQVIWSHGNNVYDVPGIDQRITHVSTGGLEESCGFSYFSFTFPMEKEFYYPYVSIIDVMEVRSRFPVNAIILGTISRMIKLESEEFLAAVAEIMKRNPNTVFLACGHGGVEKIRSYVQKLNIADRFYFEGHINAHVYGKVIDLFLDTFPMGQGESLNEYRAKGGVYVTLYQSDNPGAIVDLCMSHTPTISAYIDAADHIIKDKACRRRLSAYIRKVSDYYSELGRQGIKTLLSFLVEGNNPASLSQPNVSASLSEPMILPRPFLPQMWNFWTAHLPGYAHLADTREDYARSPLILLENGIRLGPAHAITKSLEKGFGCYAHYKEYLSFSSSDNSDPNTNGRTYEIRFA